MAITLGFDVYGTLIDTSGLVASLEVMVGARAAEFSDTWREKQLEYSFRRGLMQNYEPFSVCTIQALEYTCQYYNVPIGDKQKSELIAGYQSLPVFEDVTVGLSLLKKANVRLFAFSNGEREAVDGLLTNAKIATFFDDIVSCDDIKSFKPNPAAYAHFLRATKSTGSEAWLVSSNPFDVIGAISAGLRAAWVKRTPTKLFDPWGIEPTETICSLVDLHTVVAT
jgi:2-haloacid dehalogenase